MQIINVIEVINNVVEGMSSFAIHEEQESQVVIEAAENHFKAVMKVNYGDAYSDEQLESFIEDGYFEDGNYSLNINSSYSS